MDPWHPLLRRSLYQVPRHPLESPSTQDNAQTKVRALQEQALELASSCGLAVFKGVLESGVGPQVPATMQEAQADPETITRDPGESVAAPPG